MSEDGIVKMIFQAEATGFEKVNAQFSTVSRQARGTATACAALTNSLAATGSAAGQAAGHAAQFIGAFMQLGVIGVAIAAVQVVIQKVSQFFIDRANAMVEAAQRAGERIRERLYGIIKKNADEVAQALDAATTQAQRQAKALETLASAYLKVSNAKNAAAKAGDDAQASELTLEKSEKMAAAASPEDKARVGAEYDVRIAQSNLEATVRQQDAAVVAAQDDLTEKKRQNKRAKSDERMAIRAAQMANDDYQLLKDANAPKAAIAEAEAKKKEADAHLENAINDRISKGAEAAAAEEAVKVALSNREAAINNARKAVVESELAERELAKAQRDATAAAIEKAKAEKAAVEAENRKAAADRQRAAIGANDERANALQNQKQGYASAFDSAFDLWRDPAAAQQAQDAAKQKTVDLKRFYQSVNRYGGKGKIDEAAELMRQGDEEGLQSRLEQWRKSSKFDGQTEQLVLAAAAKKNEGESERALANIEKNTADLARKLDELLQVK